MGLRRDLSCFGVRSFYVLLEFARESISLEPNRLSVNSKNTA